MHAGGAATGRFGRRGNERRLAGPDEGHLLGASARHGRDSGRFAGAGIRAEPVRRGATGGFPGATRATGARGGGKRGETGGSAGRTRAGKARRRTARRGVQVLSLLGVCRVSPLHTATAAPVRLGCLHRCDGKAPGVRAKPGAARAAGRGSSYVRA